ncbi:uncharacterized protein BO97DRAFT_271202 [Aspergillus homomorphus CBS 101889]|uniref:Anaphase-promoting complex subunit 11 n=1 Tax=Aspergillus homomorphus (strain CBS 101889) TaxID=1450537 RepID=A0A395I432_ASPHC|nr:hypothetical protein BO97DRAFT_271202 [Aspergillus homomorphus CBS 101889]RAL14489.1 hypothetical protein BO97DRAFT_271202 [Aspergillus homomorphus CBS 101889]
MYRYTAKPAHLSEILDLYPAQESLCAGWALSKGRLCSNPVKAANRASAVRLLDEGSRRTERGEYMDDLIIDLASLVLCHRHTEQASGLVQEWQGQIQGVRLASYEVEDIGARQEVKHIGLRMETARPETSRRENRSLPLTEVLQSRRYENSPQRSAAEVSNLRKPEVNRPGRPSGLGEQTSHRARIPAIRVYDTITTVSSRHAASTEQTRIPTASAPTVLRASASPAHTQRVSLTASSSSSNPPTFTDPVNSSRASTTHSASTSASASASASGSSSTSTTSSTSTRTTSTRTTISATTRADTASLQTTSTSAITSTTTTTTHRASTRSTSLSTSRLAPSVVTTTISPSSPTTSRRTIATMDSGAPTAVSTATPPRAAATVSSPDTASSSATQPTTHPSNIVVPIMSTSPSTTRRVTPTMEPEAPTLPSITTPLNDTATTSTPDAASAATTQPSTAEAQTTSTPTSPRTPAPETAPATSAPTTSATPPQRAPRIPSTTSSDTTSQATPRPETSTPPPRTPEPKPEKPYTPTRKPIEGDCPICYEPLVPNPQLSRDLSIVYCKRQCGTNFHFNCMFTWRQVEEMRPSCPMCRKAWE